MPVPLKAASKSRRNHHKTDGRLVEFPGLGGDLSGHESPDAERVSDSAELWPEEFRRSCAKTAGIASSRTLHFLNIPPACRYAPVLARF